MIVIDKIFPIYTNSFGASSTTSTVKVLLKTADEALADYLKDIPDNEIINISPDYYGERYYIVVRKKTVVKPKSKSKPTIKRTIVRK